MMAFKSKNIKSIILLVVCCSFFTHVTAQPCDCPPSSPIPIDPVTNIINGGPVTSCLDEPSFPPNSSIFGGPFIYSGDCVIGLNRYLSRMANAQSLSDLIYQPEWVGSVGEDCVAPYNLIPNTAYCPDKYCEMINAFVQMDIQFLERVYLGSAYHEPFPHNGNWFLTGKQVVRDINYAYDLAGKRRPIIQATCFEVADSKNFDSSQSWFEDGQIPDWMITKYFCEYPEDYAIHADYYFNPPDANGCRSAKDALYWQKDRIFSPDNNWHDYNIALVEMRMYFLYQAYTLIDMGFTALHMGLYRAYAGENVDPGHTKLIKLTQEFREYASLRGSFVLLSCEPQNYESPKDPNTDIFIFDFDSRALRPREISNPPVNGDGSPPNGCSNALDPEVIDAMTNSPCSLNPLDLPALLDTCTINSQGGGSGISPLGCYVDELPYIIQWDGFSAPQNPGHPSPGFTSLTWGFHDHHWFSILDEECQRWWFDFFYCYQSRYSNQNGWLTIPGVIVAGSDTNIFMDIDARQYISDDPLFVNLIDSVTLSPADPLISVVPSSCSPLRLESTCNYELANRNECFLVGDQCYDITVKNTDCSSVYSIHIKNPLGQWLPQVHGTSHQLCPLMSGLYEISVRQDNLGLADEQNIFGVQTVTDYFNLNRHCCNENLTYPCEPCCPPGFVVDVNRCLYDVNLYNAIGEVDNSSGHFYTDPNCIYFTNNDCCPPGTFLDRFTGRCYFPVSFDPSLYQGYYYNGDFYTNAIACDDPIQPDVIEVRQSQAPENHIDEIHILLAPNPFSDNFDIWVETGLWTKCEISVYSTIGELLDRRLYENGSNMTISIGSEMPSGLYMVSIETERNTVLKKVVKQ